MNSMPSGSCQSLATLADLPTIAITYCSSPVLASVDLNHGSVSSSPTSGSTSSVS